MFLSNILAVFGAEPRISLVTLVDRAVSYAQVNGKEKALEEFNDENGDFVDGDRYIFAEDFNANVLALPFEPEMIGKNRFEERDFYGALYKQDLVDAAKEGMGLVYYIYPNPQKTMTPNFKMSYVRKLDND